MKHLMLLRHAKSAWPAGVPDHHRPLAPRGQQAAPLIGRHMAASGHLPALALVSTARRAAETWALVADAIGRPIAARPEPRLYNADPETLLEVVRALPASLPSVLLVGHNPSAAELSLQLAHPATSDQDALERLMLKVPTAAFAVLAFAVERWDQLAEREGILLHYMTPRLLGGIDED